MSSANVLPSAPAYGDREETQLYPSLPTNAENFRLTEISKIEKEISAEAEHYRLVLKKYKKVRKVIHYSVVCLGAVTAALSSGAVATSLTGVGIVIGVPVAAVAGISGAASTGLSVINKKLERKVNKHSRILALAVAKHDSINSSVSQALNDNLVSDKEFITAAESERQSQLRLPRQDDPFSLPSSIKKNDEVTFGGLRNCSHWKRPGKRPGKGPVNTETSATVCEGDSHKISCQGNQKIEITAADFGRTAKDVCPAFLLDLNTNCHSPSALEISKKECDGYTECTLYANTDEYGEPCFGTKKYLTWIRLLQSFQRDINENEVTFGGVHK
ncbi:hypothetical protein ACROYT_G016781 [Oculina patagonica]